MSPIGEKYNKNEYFCFNKNNKPIYSKLYVSGYR